MTPVLLLLLLLSLLLLLFVVQAQALEIGELINQVQRA